MPENLTVTDSEFPRRGAPTPEENLLFHKIFPENYMKIKKLDRKGALVPNAPSWIRKCLTSHLQVICFFHSSEKFSVL